MLKMKLFTLQIGCAIPRGLTGFQIGPQIKILVPLVSLISLKILKTLFPGIQSSMTKIKTLTHHWFPSNKSTKGEKSYPNKPFPIVTSLMQMN